MRHAWLGVGLLVGALVGSNVMAGERTAADLAPATKAINAFGLDLLAKMPDNGNVIISPYSIEAALAMTYAGAAGDTKAEMARVLHFPNDEAALQGRTPPYPRAEASGGCSCHWQRTTVQVAQGS